MSGEFRPEQQTSIESTDDVDLARQFGLTSFNRETGLYTAPTAPDAGQRDGEDVRARQHAEAKADGDQQHDEAQRKLHLVGNGPGKDVTEHDERKPGAPNKAAKATAAKDKDDDKGDDSK